MKNYDKWTETENKLLQEYYQILSHAELSKVLPGRSRNAMTKQMQYLTRKNKV